VKSVVYWWHGKIDTEAFKQQLDAVIAAAVFDTEPAVVISSSQQSLDSRSAKALSALEMLGITPLYTHDNATWVSIVNEADHVIRF